MQKNRGLRTLAIAAIMISLLGLVVGYSALSQTLLIGAKTTVKGADWSVHFDTTSLSEPTLTGSATVLNPATITITQIDIDVSLTKPNDSVVYTFDVVNDGTLDAKLSADPTFSGISEASAKNVSFTLTYLDGTEIKANDELNAKTTRHLKLTVSMNDVTSVEKEDAILNLSATLLYVQK